MSSLVWPWPERMVSGLKPTKLSWLAVVQKKAPQPSCLSWMVLILMSRKQKRQTGPVFGCPKFVLWRRQLKKGAKSGLIWGNTVQQEPRKMSKAMSTSTSQRMWWRRRKRTWTRSWARWIREALTISCPGWHSSVYEFSTTTTATRISSNVDYQFCHYHSLIAISIHLATHHQK